MPQASQVSNSFTFVGGLLSEASPLTFPENASLDELNFNLLRNGSREKRLGLDYESDFSQSADINTSQFQDGAVNTFVWKSVSEDGSLSFLVTQIGSTIRFHDISESDDSISSGLKAFTIDLETHKSPNALNAFSERVSMSSGKGFLFLNSKNIEPLYVKYTASPEAIEVIEYAINIRDFEGIDDGLEIDERPSSSVGLSDEHEYNLRNQGWGQRVIGFGTSTFALDFDLLRSEVNVYPSNADIAHLAMTPNPDEGGEIQFRASTLRAQYFGNSPAPKGKFILNLFNQDRSEVSEVPNIDSVIIDSRPQTTAFFSSRVFTALGSTVYFSQIIEKEENISKFHQEADPTSENTNELLSIDGGVIPIPDSGEIKTLISAASGLLVFASNGVWFISGQDNVFTATNLQNTFISSIGIQSNTAVLQVESTAIYHSDSGIYTVKLDDVSGRPSVINITENTIQTFFLNISPAARNNMTSVYDSLDKKIYWMYNTDPDYDGSTFKNRYDGLLVLDTVLQSFYPLKIEQLTTNSPFIYGGFLVPELKTLATEVTVIDSSGDIVVDTSINTVVIDESVNKPSSSTLVFLTARPATNFNYTFSQFSNTNFLDWFKQDSIGKGYESFLLTGYMLQGDIMRFKQSPYIQTAFNRSENSFQDNGSGGIEFDRPSSCLLEARWDWSDNTVSGKFTSSQELYRFKRNFISGGIGDSFDNGLPVVTTKTKIRGRGRSLHLKFTSPAGKDCQLLGWALLNLGTTDP